jgi:hypothetical protein
MGASTPKARRRRSVKPDTLPRTAGSAKTSSRKVTPIVSVALKELALHMSSLAPRHIVDLLTSPSWEVGRLIKASFEEGVYWREIGFQPDVPSVWSRTTARRQRIRKT